MSEDYAIRIRDLHKHFGDVQAVQGVTLDVCRGKIMSLLGPNGAGKSTTISMLCGLLPPSGGEAWIMGHSIIREPMAAKAALGVVPQDIALYTDMSARENLTFWGRMYGLKGAALRQRVDEVLEIIGLSGRQKEPIGRFSGGMKRRVNIAVSLLHRPKVLILDEPTVGIDPQSRRHILDNVRELNRQGMTVLYTTHYMEEAQELSDHIAIIDQGRLVAQGTHGDLVKIVGELDRVDLVLNVLPPLDGRLDRLLAAWKGLPGVRRISMEPAGGDQQVAAETLADGPRPATLLVEDGNLVLPRLFESATGLGVRITSVDVQEPNLEAVFLHLTGKALRDA